MTDKEHYHFESELVERIKQGDTQAEFQLVDHYERGVMMILRRRCNDEHLCQDVSQETWLLVISKIRAGELRDSRRLNGFVTQIARNQLTMALRNRQRQMLSGDGDELQTDLVDQNADPESAAQNADLGNAVAETLNNMKQPRDRELIVRFYYYGDSKEELCERFDLASASFDSIIARARNRFKQGWQEAR